MRLKEELTKLKDGLLGVTNNNGSTKVGVPLIPAGAVSLDAKVDSFMKWYYKNMVEGHYTAVGEYHQAEELRNLIEKMAVWYELRYPSYTIHKMFPGSNQENRNVSEIMFDRNEYINEQLDKDAETRILDWEEFYNAKAFIDSLPCEERYFFNSPRYQSIVYVTPFMHFHLTRDGIVEEAENIEIYSKGKVKSEEVEGLHVKQAKELLKERGFFIPLGSELETMLQNIDNYIAMQEGILDCAMYRIIERGGNRVGPRRGLLFAKEFHRNIDIPMMYGVDSADPGLRIFLNEYIKAGGSLDLVCYENYFSRTGNTTILTTSVVGNLLANRWHDGITKYTPEEKELQQKLVNTLSSQVDPKELEREKVKQLRIERKLEKSRIKKFDE